MFIWPVIAHNGVIGKPEITIFPSPRSPGSAFIRILPPSPLGNQPGLTRMYGWPL